MRRVATISKKDGKFPPLSTLLSRGIGPRIVTVDAGKVAFIG